MGCNLKDFSEYTNKFLEIEKFRESHVNGVVVEGRNKVSKIATAVTASIEAIKKAIKLKADVLLVHHGFFFSASDPKFVLSGVFKQKIKLLLENDITLMAYHLPLDVHQEVGNNFGAAKALKFKSIKSFGIYQGNFIGVKGSVSPCTRLEFQKKLEDFYGNKATIVFGGKEKISSCALISGRAYSYIQDAASEDIDCFVTGSFDEPAYHSAYEEKINFMALGHAATEKIGVKLLGEHLKKKFKLEHYFIDEPNPF